MEVFLGIAAFAGILFGALINDEGSGMAARGPVYASGGAWVNGYEYDLSEKDDGSRVCISGSSPKIPERRWMQILGLVILWTGVACGIACVVFVIW